MDKKRLLTILWMCVGIISTASAVEVISIDINYYDPNAPAYSGQAAVPGATQWIAYCGGWGIPMGSPKSANLVKSTGPTQAGTYAEQVWIGDPGNHNYVQGAGTGLLDDGFDNKNTSSDPNIPYVTLFGGQGAYGGTFDMYVYGNEAGDFSVKKPDSNDLITQHINGNTTGAFVEGETYVVFQNLSVGDPNQIQLFYTNRLSGIQLVSKKVPVVVQSTTVINAANYDVAYDTNNRSGEITLWGPDIGYASTIGYFVSYLAAGEYMDYDLNLTTSTMGQYNVSSRVTTVYGPASMQIFVDGSLIGALVCSQYADGSVYETNALKINLFPGIHTLRWKTPANRNNNILDFKFNKIGPVVMTNCSQVKTYGFKYAGDLTGDCQVGLDDMAIIIADWANCYDPAPGACN